MLIAAAIFTMLQCTPNGTYCGIVSDPNEGILKYPTAEACKAGAIAQTRAYEKAGSHGYYGECVSLDSGMFTLVE